MFPLEYVNCVPSGNFLTMMVDANHAHREALLHLKEPQIVAFVAAALQPMTIRVHVLPARQGSFPIKRPVDSVKSAIQENFHLLVLAAVTDVRKERPWLALNVNCAAQELTLMMDPNARIAFQAWSLLQVGQLSAFLVVAARSLIHN